MINKKSPFRDSFLFSNAVITFVYQDILYLGYILSMHYHDRKT